MLTSNIHKKQQNLSNNCEKVRVKPIFSICREGYYQSRSIALFRAKNKRTNSPGLTAISSASACGEKTSPSSPKTTTLLVDLDLMSIDMCFVPLMNKSICALYLSSTSQYVLCTSHQQVVSLSKPP